jgi:hypothetical protein
MLPYRQRHTPGLSRVGVSSFCADKLNNRKRARSRLPNPKRPVPHTAICFATLFSDIKFPVDAVEPTWSDRAPTDPDLAPVIVIPAATNGPR